MTGYKSTSPQGRPTSPPLPEPFTPLKAIEGRVVSTYFGSSGQHITIELAPDGSREITEIAHLEERVEPGTMVVVDRDEDHWKTYRVHTRDGARTLVDNFPCGRYDLQDTMTCFDPPDLKNYLSPARELSGPYQ